MSGWERHARRLVGGLVAAALVVGGAVGLSAAPASAGISQVSAAGMVGDVNDVRRGRGLRSLSTDGALTSVALAQARRMASRNSLFHNPNLTSDVKNYRWVGENVGYGPSLGVIQDAFMKSPSHKANILDDDFTQVGIAAVRDGKGRTWVAQVFRRPSSSTTTTRTRSSAPKASKRTRKDRDAKARDTRTRDRAQDAKGAGKRSANRRRSGSASSAGDAAAATPSRPTSSTRAPGRRTDRPAPTPSRTTRSAPQTPASTPSATVTLEQRVATAAGRAQATTDPVDDALAFADAMSTVGG